MTDRKRTRELVEAVQVGLRAIQRDPSLSPLGQGAELALGVLDRELRSGLEPLRAEWARLNHVEGVERPLPDDLDDLADALAERRRTVCLDIRDGRYDEGPARAALYEHLVASVRTELELVDPDYLAALAKEGVSSRGRRQK